MVRPLHALAVIAACALSFGASQSFAATTSYDFSSVSGSSTPESIGIATFSSPSDPGAYTFGSNGGLFSTLGSYVLGANGTTATELDISFASPQTAVSFGFGLVDLLALNGNDNLDVALNHGPPHLFGTTIPGSDLFPQGTVTLTSIAYFTSVEITSANPANTIVIADLFLTPEPASMAVLGAGLAGLLAARRRRA